MNCGTLLTLGMIGMAGLGGWCLGYAYGRDRKGEVIPFPRKARGLR